MNRTFISRKTSVNTVSVRERLNVKAVAGYEATVAGSLMPAPSPKPAPALHPSQRVPLPADATLGFPCQTGRSDRDYQSPGTTDSTREHTAKTAWPHGSARDGSAGT